HWWYCHAGRQPAECHCRCPDRLNLYGLDAESPALNAAVITRCGAGLVHGAETGFKRPGGGGKNPGTVDPPTPADPADFYCHRTVLDFQCAAEQAAGRVIVL